VAWHALGKLESEQGNFHDARIAYRQGIKTGDDSCRVKCYLELAQLEVLQGMFEEAGKEFEKGAAMGGRLDATYMQAWVRFEKRHGHEERTRELFRASSDLSPHDPRVWLQWGMWERSRARVDAARACFSKGVKRTSGNAFLWQAWAVLEAYTAQDVESARRLFAKGTKACPEDAPLWMEWALMEQTKGEGVQRARELFQRGSQIQPLHAPLLSAWARLEETNGNAAKAAELDNQLSEIEAMQRGVFRGTP